MMRKLILSMCIALLALALGVSASFAAAPAYTLTVGSANPTSGVAITVSPADKNGAANGTTQFTRTYAKGAVVTLTAPATSTGGAFAKWQKNGVDYATTPQTTVTMSANTTMTASFGASGHAGITGTFNTPADVTAKCLTCHAAAGTDLINSLHGMKAMPAPNVTNDTGASQKLGEINTFCSYPNPAMAGSACLSCHPTLGKFSNLTAADLDCLMCHNDSYKRRFVAETDPANFYNVVDWTGASKTYIPADKDASGNFHVEFNWSLMPGLTALDLVRNVKKPTTTTCLNCHAKAGGGDWVKRGDIGLNSANPTVAQDVHLASTASGGAGLSCASCHVSNKHQIPGRGIDLRPTEGGAVKKCADCHANMAATGAHAALGYGAEPDRHMKRVSCQACHIANFAKGGATEMSRNWTQHVWDPAFCNGQGGWLGEEVKLSNVIPDLVFFNGTSYVYSLGQLANKIDPVSGITTLADANGGINDALGTSLLVPIKRHQSTMAVMSSGTNVGKVIPYDVVWQFMTGKNDEAAERGKAFAGFTGSHEWKLVEAEMGINHGVANKENVAACTNCHHARGQFTVAFQTKLDKLGYKLRDANKDGVVNATDEAMICSQCHLQKSFKTDWQQQHAHTQKGSGIGCSFCHDIKRYERGLCEPCNPDGTQNNACINEFVDNQYINLCQ